MRGEVVVVHSSDIHVDVLSSYVSHARDGDELHALRQVLRTAEAVGADVLLLVGDIFDNNRVPAPLLERAAELLAGATLPVVILPGNHDPLTDDSVYRRGRLADLPHVHVLGVSVDEAVVFPELDLEIWGRAHLDYSDMSPLRDPRPRTTRWQIAAAHGHFQSEPVDPDRFYASWLIREADLAATGADYVALGHWNRPVPVGNGTVPAYYSGSPDLAETVNVVRFAPGGSVQVTREPLRADEE